MNNEMIKQAYAYGASVALKEAGYAPQVAEQLSVKLAAEADAEGAPPEGGVPGLGEITTKQKVLSHLLGPIAAGASAPEGAGAGRFGRTLGYGAAGAGIGGVGGGAAGAGIGALIAHLLKKDPGMGAVAGGLGGYYGGGVLGQQLGIRKGLQQSAKAEQARMGAGEEPKQASAAAALNEFTARLQGR